MLRRRHFSEPFSLRDLPQFGFTSSGEKLETEVDGRHGSLARHA
jgi:hypothetical protein